MRRKVLCSCFFCQLVAAGVAAGGPMTATTPVEDSGPIGRRILPKRKRMSFPERRCIYAMGQLEQGDFSLTWAAPVRYKLIMTNWSVIIITLTDHYVFWRRT